MPDIYDPFTGLYSKRELHRIRGWLKDELARSMKLLKKPGTPPVYFLSYLFRNHRQEKIWGRLGAVGEHSVQSQNSVYCDLRVGGYRYDNVTNGGLGDNSDKDESLDYILMPAEVHADSFKYSLWRLTDARYREAQEQYYDRKSRELHYVDPNRKLPARVKRPPLQALAYHECKPIDQDYWKYLIRRAGELVKKYSNIKNSWIEFTAQHRQNLLVNSEGSQILQQHEIYELRAHLWLLNKQGDGIIQEINLIEGRPDCLPPEKDFLKLVKAKIDLLLALEKAPNLNSYSGPVMLSPNAAGLFFHEVIGHRLEGSRLLSSEEGSTFRDLQGKRITPEYIDIIDDPTMQEFQGRAMIGHFKFDDEGSLSKRAVLVEKGVLKNFLTATNPIPGQRSLNGHARNQKHERPISRMGNLCIVNRKPVANADMRALFIEEIKRQKKPFGIWIKDVLGGETGTSRYDFQAFKGEILHAMKVYANGKEEPVRGADFVGTPLSALDSVICLGDDAALDNSYCGAESGTIPVSTVSPSMLMRNLELQAKERERLTQYAMPLPYKTYSSA